MDPHRRLTRLRTGLVIGGTGTRPLRSYPLAAWIACHTRCGVVGIGRSRTPSGASASITALCAAEVEPMVVDSPMPLAPIGLTGVGVSIDTSSNAGSSAAEIGE